MRTLIDTGASFSIISPQLVSRIPYAKINHNDRINLRGVTGTHLNIKGNTDISFDIGNQTITHTFIICENISEQMILGTDFLKKYEVEISYKNRSISFNDETIQLDNHEYLTSLVKAAQNTKIKPNSTNICYVKARQQRYKVSDKEYLVSRIDSGMLANEPGIYAADGLVSIKSHKKFPIMIVNSTNRHINIKKGMMIAKLEQIDSICSYKETVMQDLKAELHIDESTPTHEKPVIPDEYKKPLDALIDEFQDIFSTGPTDIGKTDLIEMSTDLEHNKPVNVYPYRIPLHHRAAVEEEVQNLLKAGIIRHSNSPYNAPSLIVRKKSGKIRLVTDFRQLNRITRPIAQGLENIDDILGSLSGAKFITTLDIKSAYHTIPIKEKDIEKTGFSVLQHHLEYTRAAFGLKQSGYYFNKLMSKILSGIKGSFVFNYSDDVIVASKSFKLHIEHLTEVFSRFRHACIKLNLDKCCFIQASTEYVGHTITQNGIEPSKNKINALLNMPRPANIKSIRSYLGFVSYYRRYIPNFSATCEPLINLTRKNVKFSWDEKCETAFQTLKQALLNPPILAFPDPNKQFILYTDASDKAIGAILKQKHGDVERIVHYISHSLSPTQQRWATLHKEAYSIIYTVDKLNHLLADTPTPFIIRTDHRPLESLLHGRHSNRKLQMWAVMLSAYNYKIEYIKGSHNNQADFMSRYVIPDSKHHKVNAINLDRINLQAAHSLSEASTSHLDTESEPPPTLDLPGNFDIIAAQQADPAIHKIMQRLSDNTASEHVKAHHSVIDGILYYINEKPTQISLRLVIPQTLQKTILHQFYDRNSHLGVTKTYDLISKRYYWKNMFQHTADYIARCLTCCTRQINTNKTPLQHTDIPTFCFEKISIDIVGKLPTTSKGNSYLLTVFDLFSSYPEAIPIPDKSAETVAKVLIRDIFTRYSIPLFILTDNGLENVNAIMDHVLTYFGSVHITTSPYRPESNSKIERFHRILNDTLAKHIYENKNYEWDQYINFVLGAIRTSVNTATKFSPHYILFKQDPILPLDTILRPRNKYLGDDQHKIDLEQMHILYTNVRDNIAHSQDRRLARENKDLQLKEYEINDPIFIKNSAMKNKYDILWKPYYRIYQKKGPRSYIVRDMITGKLYKTHVQHMKLAKMQWNIPPPRQQIRRARLACPRENDNTNSSSHISTETASYEADSENSDNENAITSDNQQSDNSVTIPKSINTDTHDNINTQHEEATELKRIQDGYTSDTSENSSDINKSLSPTPHPTTPPRYTRTGRRVIKPARYRQIDVINCSLEPEQKHHETCEVKTIHEIDQTANHVQKNIETDTTSIHSLNPHKTIETTTAHTDKTENHMCSTNSSEANKQNSSPQTEETNNNENLSTMKIQLLEKMLDTLSTIK